MRNQKRLTFWLITGIALGITLIAVMFFLLSSHRLDMPVHGTQRLDARMAEESRAQTKVLSVTLPEDFDETRSLLFKTTHTQLSVTVGRESIYTYDSSGKTSFMRSPGAVWHIVNVPKGSAGKTLSIFIHAVFEDYYGNDPVIRYGSREGCAMQIMTSSLPIVLINAIILFVGISCLMMHAFGRIRRSMVTKNSFLFIGLFALSIATWSLCQSGFLQFLFPNGPTLNLIDFFSFYIFPTCFNLFLASICKGKSETVFCALSAGYLLESALSTVLQFAGVMDMFRFLIFGHILMAINAVCVFVFVHVEIYRENNDIARKFRLPLYVVISFGVAELVTYYLNNFRQTSYFLPIGTVVFIVMLFTQLIQQYYASILEEQKMAYFKKLANTDMLTDVFNRNAYENTLRRLEEQEMELRTTCVVLFDINNMKEINDHYGHENGDLALKTCCRCILQAFGPEGSCYRIGGDEFVYLCNKSAHLTQAAARFEALIRQQARDLVFPFSVACGYASYNPATDRALRDVIRRSDEMMYRNKDAQKRSGVPFPLSTESAISVDK